MKLSSARVRRQAVALGRLRLINRNYSGLRFTSPPIGQTLADNASYDLRARRCRCKIQDFREMEAIALVVIHSFENMAAKLPSLGRFF